MHRLIINTLIKYSMELIINWLDCLAVAVASNCILFFTSEVWRTGHSRPTHTTSVRYIDSGSFDIERIIYVLQTGFILVVVVSVMIILY